MSMSVTRMLIVGDPRNCRGCGSCELVCSLRLVGECRPSLSAVRVLKDIFRIEFRPETCRQCLTPACMLACRIEGAMYVDQATGARMIDQARCVGCRACELACPFHAVRYRPETNTCVKCDLCSGAPECVEYCPRDALILVQTGRRREAAGV
ncbi:MAG: 4Fe-4S dicluster domain-containing protein [Candidatus Bathyarchaeia archaeon]